jgi:hypothetical protein
MEQSVVQHWLAQVAPPVAEAARSTLKWQVGQAMGLRLSMPLSDGLYMTGWEIGARVQTIMA